MVDLKDQEMVEGMQCITHPYTKNPGGICALCLQDKLGKLVTSSFPLPKPNNHSSSPPPPKPSSTTSLALRDSINNNNNNNLPFLLAKKKKSMLTASSSSSSSSSTSSSTSSSANLMYKRSKSTASSYGESFGQRKRSGFWSFLHLYSSKHQINTTTKKVDNFSHLKKNHRETTMMKKVDVIVEEQEEEEEEVVRETSFDRKVLRSRSVGCGSRSFSGDFFGKISNGFGDCALRRIESQRECTKVISNGNDDEGVNVMSDMVKCGGIFGGFMIMTPSSSSSSTTSSSNVVHHHHHKSRGWGFASPMRAKTTHKDRTITESTTNDKNKSPNLDSIPSLLALKS